MFLVFHLDVLGHRLLKLPSKLGIDILKYKKILVAPGITVCAPMLACQTLKYPNLGLKQEVGLSQLPGRLFSPSDICKKLSHYFLLHFPIGMGSYDHHAKYQGVFMDLK